MTKLIERRFFAPFVLTLALISSACGGMLAGGQDDTPTPQPTATATPKPLLSLFRNFVFPIEGACLPSSDDLMPNAEREYRGGVHEGVDLYGTDNCVAIPYETQVMAAKDGVVIRADLNYHDLTQEELDAADERIAKGEANAPDVVDLFRGRQVWIDHGDGIVTRYAHLSAVAEGVTVGAHVLQGQLIAYVGDSGTPESLTSPRSESHLHWEVRTGDTYLGKGLPPDEVRDIYQKLFEPWP